MIENLILKNRRLRIEYNNVLKGADQDGKEILTVLHNYLNEYSSFYNINAVYAESSYSKFVAQYVSDFRLFKETGKYPFELKHEFNLGRIDYDLALILSVFFIPARLVIFQELIKALKNTTGNILIIGIGAAIEVELITNFLPDRKFDAYDISISDFVKKRYKTIGLYEQEFKFEKNTTYDCIVTIELLEHLSNPYAFFSQCVQCLSKNGHLICTTASNMPQFDHLFNFYNQDFEAQIGLTGLNILLKRELKHSLLNSSIQSYNTFYCLFKK